MPIICTHKLSPITQDQFRQLDYSIMGEAFSIHNTLGRLLDESIYQEALRHRCEQLDLGCIRELEILVSHKSFSKRYYADLVVQNGAVYELKTTAAITPSHETQLLNYLLLCGVSHGKIVNFRSHSVQSRFVSTSLTEAERHSFKIVTQEWIPQSAHCNAIPSITKGILNEWGTHLDVALYREALLHLIAPDSSLLRHLDFNYENQPVGRQQEYLLNETTALHTSSLRSGLEAYRKHLLRLLKHTGLHAIQWINFGTDEIRCTTITA